MGVVYVFVSRTVRVAMQVPVVMTSLGQKISTMAVHSGSSALLTNSGPMAGGGAPKVLIQTIPTVMPATAENGDKITVQLAKIITIPAAQLAQCQLQAKAGPGTTGAPSFSLVGAPLAVRTLAPVSVGPGAQVVRLAVPGQQVAAQSGHAVVRLVSPVAKAPAAEQDPHSPQTAGADAPAVLTVKIEDPDC